MTTPDRTAESGGTPNEFTANDLDWLLKVHEAVFDAIEKAETRLVVEVWGKDDMQPVAWIDGHPDDSDLRICFANPSTSPGGGER